MNQALIDQAIEYMKRQRFGEALPLLRRAIDQDPSLWNAWYMAGQCCRFLEDLDGAIEHLSRAAELKKDEAPIFLALGIAFQLRAQWGQAIESFRRAIEIDPDYELAYNSLALTQKKQGDLDEAFHNYDAGAKALARQIVKAMRNNRNSPILKHRETVGTLWAEYATYAALYLVSTADGISDIAWPTGAQALEEERTEKHAGLYWTDVPNDKRETVRLFLPNYFNTFRESLRRDIAYSNLLGNRGTVLELLGHLDEARQHFDEATEFRP
ncbi:MAG: tetratricopeptide repeat protein [Planctomycetes bacterium]|nr:tetratricopeptide repeat protein [Planctomycetota bacterium]